MIRKGPGYSLIRNGGQPKFTLRKSGNIFDLVTYEKEEQINGETFIREVTNWKTSISGKCMDSSGNWHDAEVHNNVLFRNGNGIDNKNGKYFTNNTDGIKYVGEFKDGKRHGQGTHTWPDDNNEYVGEFKKGNMHGQGKKSWPNGSTYEGGFKEGYIAPDIENKVTINSKEVEIQEYRIKPDKFGKYPRYLVPESANKIPNLQLIEYHGIQ